MKKRIQPDSEIQFPDYTLAFLESEGRIAKPRKVRSTKRIVLVLMLGVLAALLAGAAIWYWSASGSLTGSRHTPGVFQTQQFLSDIPAFPWKLDKTVNFFGISPLPFG